jgi:hypothetical protein
MSAAMNHERGPRHTIIKNRFSLAATLFFGLLFMILIGFRTGVWNREKRAPALTATEITVKDTWMSILQRNRKIGYTHRMLTPSETGFSLTEVTYMKLNVMGMAQEIFVETGGSLDKSFALSSFNFSLKSGLFQFIAYGGVKEKNLIIYINGKRTVIPIDEAIHLSAGMVEAVWSKGLKPGDSKTIDIFDPSTLSKRPVTITVAGKETVKIMGEKIPSTKLLIDFMGTQQSAWMDDMGEIVKEEGLLSLSLERTDKEKALSGISDKPMDDVIDLASVKPDKAIKRPENLKKLIVKIGGLKTSMDLDGGRQTYRDGLLTITRESPADLNAASGHPDLSAYLRPEPFIQSDHPEIVTIARKITDGSQTDLDKALKILQWMNQTIEKRPVVSIPDALTTLQNKTGDCNEHAVLAAAIARAAQLPADIESGVVYMKGGFFYHAWNRLYIGNAWVTFDAALNQFPADVTHIRLVQGGLEKQMDLISVIGKMTLSIMGDGE